MSMFKDLLASRSVNQSKMPVPRREGDGGQGEPHTAQWATGSSRGIGGYRTRCPRIFSIQDLGFS